MGAQAFGRLVDQAMTAKGMSQDRLAVLVGELPDGRVLNGKQVSRIREGTRRLDPWLVSRLIDLLGLDLDPTTGRKTQERHLAVWKAAGLWPAGKTVEDLSELPAARVEAAQRAAHEGAAAAASPLTADQRKPTTAYFNVLREEAAA